MIHTLSVKDFLQKATTLPVLDVRSPKEYAVGHMPAAHSFPIFNDTQRAAIGTAYKQQGHDPAVLLGLDAFGPSMAGFVKQAEKLAVNKELLVHCWRGGMRSGAMAWLLSFAGYTVYLLEGGYKTYRHLMQAQFAKPRPILILGGLTGSGKTDLLPYLHQLGQQSIDLEGLANHKGSAFGSINMPPQPSVEHFENLLGMALRATAENRTLWLEDESITIGKVIMPAPFFDQMRAAPAIVLQVAKNLRVEKLAEEYCRIDKGILEAAILKIKKRLGGLVTQQALAAIAADDMETMVDLALAYYDKTYTYGLAQRQRILPLDLQRINPEENAAQVLHLAQKHNLL